MYSNRINCQLEKITIEGIEYLKKNTDLYDSGTYEFIGTYIDGVFTGKNKIIHLLLNNFNRQDKARQSEENDELQQDKEELSAKTMMISQDEDEAYIDYNLGLVMWLKYGFTKEQYDANLEYESNLRALEEFYRDYDYQNHPDYEMRLKSAIKKYKDNFGKEQNEQYLKDQQNEWWKEYEVEDQQNEQYLKVLQDEQNERWKDYEVEEDKDQQNEWWKDYEVEEDDDEDKQYDDFESFEDYCERRREQDIEFEKQNAIDDMYDDYYC